MYAHVTDGTVDSVGQPPQIVTQDGRDWDLRPRDLTTLAAVGWYPVQEATRPADTATMTSEPVFTLTGDVVVQSWNVVAKTAEQIAAETAATNEQELLDKARAALTANATFLALTSPTNAQTLAQVQRMTRELNALIKLEVRDLTDQSGT